MEHRVLSSVRRGMAMDSEQVRWPQRSRCCLSLFSAATWRLAVRSYFSALQSLLHPHWGQLGEHWCSHPRYVPGSPGNQHMNGGNLVCAWFTPCYAARVCSQTKNGEVLLGLTLEKTITASFCGWEEWS